VGGLIYSEAIGGSLIRHWLAQTATPTSPMTRNTASADPITSAPFTIMLITTPSKSCSDNYRDLPLVHIVSGQVTTYTQRLGDQDPISTTPSNAHIPASPNRVSFTSSVVYASIPNPSIKIGTPTPVGFASAGTGGSRGAASQTRSDIAKSTPNTSNKPSALVISGLFLVSFVLLFASSRVCCQLRRIS